MAPMTRVRAAAEGLATPSMATYYAQRATAGLIVSEGVQPSLIGQSNPGTPGLYTDQQVALPAGHRRRARERGPDLRADHARGASPHPDTTGLVPVGPSAVSGGGGMRVTPTGPRPRRCPAPWTTAEAPEHAQSYAAAARLAAAAAYRRRSNCTARTAT
ncbi:Alkene reductase OS=Streptomyces microflavus OX=1919 GN=HUT09_18645 PE=4 SV=1 [Streptomyces microflavus]